MTNENTNGDHISREELKEAFRNNCVHNCYYCKLARWDKKGACYICGLIDNAPSVEIATKLQQRKGKWITGKNGNIKCNQCGCEIRYFYLIGNEPDFPKYCCDCGVKMETGAENDT